MAVNPTTGQVTIDASSAGDDWGSQVASTTARLTGDGTAGDPLDIAQQGATSGQALKWNGTSWAPAADNVNDADSDPTNEHQDLGFVNGGSTYGYFEHTVTITDGSNATIRDYYDPDTDEQDLSLVGTNLNITDGTGVSLAGFMDNTDEQDLSYTASTRALGISGGTGVTLPLVTSADAGLAPSSGGGTTNYLRADGTWAEPPGTASGTITEVIAGNGLTGGGSSGSVTLHANPDGSSIEIVSDALQVRALGIKDYHIDWGHGAGQVDADNVPFAPSTSGDWSMGIDPGDVDDALDQLANRVDGLESGTGSVTSITGGTGISPAGPVSGAVDLSINTAELSLTGLSAPSATSLNVLYGTTANTAVEGNETATITAGTGLTGGISGDALGNGFSATLNVNFGGTGTATTASRSDHTHAYDNYSAWNLQAEGGASTAISSGETVNFTGSGDATVTRTGNTIDIDVTATGDGNNYVTGASFNTSTGDLTLTRSGLSSITENLDGRYLTSFNETDPTWSGTANTTSSVSRTGNVGFGASAHGTYKVYAYYDADHIGALGGSSYGVYGQGTSAGHSGVYGWGDTGVRGQGSNYGLYGSSSYIGVYSTGTTYDFYASNSSADNYFAGNVGINKTSPSQRLDVVGRVRFNDPSYIDTRYIEIYSSGANYINGTNDLYIRPTGGMILQPGYNNTVEQGVQIKTRGGTQYGVFDGTTSRFGMIQEFSTPGSKLSIQGNASIGGLTYATTAAPSNGMIVEGNVGIGTTSPNNKLEITHGTSGNSGLRFTNLTSASSAGAAGTKVLSVDASGNVVLVTDATGGSSLWTDVGSNIYPATATNFTIYDNSSSYVGQWFMSGTDCNAIANLINGTESAYLCYEGSYGLYGSSGTYGVYGVNGSNYGYLGGASYGVYGTDGTRYGYLGGASYGVYGTNGTNYGYLGSSSYGVYGYGTYGGYFSGTSYGVYASVSGDYGVYGYNSSSSAGDHGVYGYQSTSSNATNYDVYSSINGTAGYLLYGNDYHFGVNGRTWGGDTGTRTGGVLGTMVSYTVWGSLSYKNSASNRYGAYWTSSGSGSGRPAPPRGGDDSAYDPGGTHINIGAGGYGDLFGLHAQGNIYGAYFEGGRYGLYTYGDRFSNGLDVHLTDVGEEDMAVSYTTTSIEAKIGADGVDRLSAGSRRVEFDSDFKKLVDPAKRVTVTVTPLGCCNGVYLSEVDENGFTVVENNGGRSDIEFMWIAMARRIDARPKTALPREVVAVDYTDKIGRGLHNDADTRTDGEGLYFEGGELIVGVHPSALPNQNLIALKEAYEKDPSSRSYEGWASAFGAEGVEMPFSRQEHQDRLNTIENQNEQPNKPEPAELPTPGPKDNIVKQPAERVY